MNLIKPLVRQGYRVYFDNFYTSVQLLKDLWKVGVLACGTMLRNRKGFPVELKNIKEFEKGNTRGAMRWMRNGVQLIIQWIDNKTISIITTIHKANKYTYIKRRTKVNGVFREIQVRQPNVVKDYNKYMKGVDKSDQLIGKYNCLRKTKKYWKTIFFHLIDIARVNAYILFQDRRRKNSDVEALKRPNRYSQLNFTEELVRKYRRI